MREARTRRRTAAWSTAVLLLGLAGGGISSAGELEDARRERAEARDELAAIAGDYEALAERYSRVQARADAAAGRLIDAYLQEGELQAEAARSRALLDGRADAIYRAGPASFVNVLLGSNGPGDWLARQELIEGALDQGVNEAAEAVEAHEEAHELFRELERGRADLVRLQQELAEIRILMELRLAEARSRALAAGERVRELVDAREELLASAELEQSYQDLAAVDGELAELLGMLGPTGGRGCQIPPDLELTGQGFEGESSFYGEEFAGNPTAIGHIFNPALFTAAHRTLPLPSFLHVQYGQRCVTVVVNDRGPYVEGRILDLSEAAAMYLGLPGVGDVRAQILRPAG
ncbi:MAG: septal ring lytic transglycosylase RlpA family protein [Actinomycetota bacterium]|nr:septal ring lytic transglycosylase RlpA family protein [Actinomycetota bacterium]